MRSATKPTSPPRNANAAIATNSGVIRSHRRRPRIARRFPPRAGRRPRRGQRQRARSERAGRSTSDAPTVAGPSVVASLGSRLCGSLRYDRVTLGDDVSVRAELRDLFGRMPKAEMHLHLDGSLRPQTALELARERGLDDGMDLAAITARLVGPPQFRDQAELLRAFDLPIAIMQDAESITRITHELVEDVASDGTRYAEIRWGPA